MISYYTKYSFVIVFSSLREEFYNYSGLGMRFNCSLHFWKWKNVCSICEKLEWSRLITLIHYIQKSVCSLSQLNFSKLNRFGRKANINSIRLPLGRKLDFISTNNFDVKLSWRKLADDGRTISYSYKFLSAWKYNSWIRAQCDRIVFAVVVYCLNMEFCLYLRVVSNIYCFLSYFANS
jgi:hypothetical protein